VSETLFDKDRCLKRNRVAALRYGVETAHVNFLNDGGGSSAGAVEYRNYGGKMPETTDEALSMINALLPEGAEPLTVEQVYVHTIEAANNSFIEDRWAFISRNTLRNVARDAASGAAFMNSHRTGGLSTDAEFPFGKSFSGQYQEGRDAAGTAVQRSLIGFYMLRGIKPNGDAGPSTDDLDKKIRGGTLFDVSVGLYGGERVCDVCGGDVDDYEACPHLPGTHYGMDEAEIEAQKSRGVPEGRASYTIEGARLGEFSGVFDGAVRGAGFRKAMSLASKLGAADLQLARETYGPLSPKGEGADDMNEGLFARLEETLAKAFRRAFGGKPPNIPAEEAADGPNLETAPTEKQEDAGMAEDKNNAAEVERFRRDSEELARIKSEQRTKDAESFAKDCIKNKKFLPFGFQNLKAEYEQRAADDEALPLASGSRVENLREMVKGLPAHNLTSEQAAARVPADATVLDNDEDPEKASVKNSYERAAAWGRSANTNGTGKRS
jgi:hypothetical protein